jgi:hypothetical protein
MIEWCAGEVGLAQHIVRRGGESCFRYGDDGRAWAHLIPVVRLSDCNAALHKSPVVPDVNLGFLAGTCMVSLVLT